MKAILITLALCAAVASASIANTHKEAYAFATQSYNRYTTGLSGQRTFNPENFQMQGLPPVSGACLQALFDLITTVNTTSCKASLVQAAHYIFDNTSQVTDAQVVNYCTTGCLPALNTTLNAYLTTCSALELVEIELFSIAQGKPFLIWELLLVVHLPCDTQIGGTHCIVSWSNLLHNLAQGHNTPDATECNLCLALFIADLIAWTPLSIKDFYFVDQFCTMDSGKFCWAEMQAINGITDQTAKINRMCSTNCYQKILIKAIFFEATNGTIDANAIKMLVYLDDMCATAPGGEYCANDFNLIGTTVDNAKNHGCALTTPCTPTSDCYNYVKDFVGIEGCCLSNMQQIADISGNGTLALDFAVIMGFIEGFCKIDVPDACPRSAHNVTLEIVVQNLEWARYQAAVDAIKHDIALIFAIDVAYVLWVEAHKTMSSGFALAGTTSSGDITYTYTVSPPDGQSAANGVTAFNNGVATGTLTTPNLQSLDMSTRTNPGQPLVISPSSSAMSGALRVSFSIATLFFAALVAIGAARF